MFDKVVFAGGGHRCWWQAGFWDALNREIEWRPRVIAGVSAGAATACMLYATDARRALSWYERELGKRRLNFDLSGLWSTQRRFFPHEGIYRKALRALLGDDNFRQLQWRAPELRVVLARLPEGMPVRTAAARGFLAYRHEKYKLGSLHPEAGRRLGFTLEMRRVQECRSERELVDLLLASSCSPPFTRVIEYDGAPCLDGGVVDNVPVEAVADVPGTTLVLTTRHFPDHAPVFLRNGHVYVQPSSRITVSPWDYTRPRRYQGVYEQGLADGQAFLRMFALGTSGMQQVLAPDAVQATGPVLDQVPARDQVLNVQPLEKEPSREPGAVPEAHEAVKAGEALNADGAVDAYGADGADAAASAERAAEADMRVDAVDTVEMTAHPEAVDALRGRAPRRAASTEAAAANDPRAAAPRASGKGRSTHAASANARHVTASHAGVDREHSKEAHDEAGATGDLFAVDPEDRVDEHGDDARALFARQMRLRRESREGGPPRV